MVNRCAVGECQVGQNFAKCGKHTHTQLGKKHTTTEATWQCPKDELQRRPRPHPCRHRNVPLNAATKCVPSIIAAQRRCLSIHMYMYIYVLVSV